MPISVLPLRTIIPPAKIDGFRFLHPMKFGVCRLSKAVAKDEKKCVPSFVIVLLVSRKALLSPFCVGFYFVEEVMPW